MRFKLVMALVAFVLFLAAAFVTVAANRADAAEGKSRPDDPGAAILRLEGRLKGVESPLMHGG